MKKTLILLALAVAFSVGNCPGCVDCRAYAADSTTPTAQNALTAFGLISLGEDNLLVIPVTGTSHKGYLAVGVGADIASYSKALTSGGSTLYATLHALAASQTTGNGVGDSVAGLSLYVDVLKLMTGTGVNFAGNVVNLTFGPIAVYNVVTGTVGIGAGMNFNYKFN